MSDEKLNNKELDNNQNLEFTKKENPEPEKPLSFIDKILEFITGISSEERVKLRKLKEINRRLKRLKFNFYDFKKDQVLDSFPQYLYDMYRMSQNIARYLDVKNHSKSIKQFIFELFSSERQKELANQLSNESVQELLIKSPNTKESIETIKKRLHEYVKSFDSETIKNINNTYNKIADISSIVNFDWFFLLHKFDSNITETNFNYKPEFEIIEGKYILDELIEFGDYIESTDFNTNWKPVINYINSVSAEESYIKVLKKIIQYCKILRKDGYIEKLVKLIYRNPYFEHKKFSSNVKVVQDYIFDFQKEIKTVVDNILRRIKKDKVDNLLLSIFHTTAILRLKYYTQKLNEQLAKKNIIGFRYIEPLNYLKAFLLDYCKGVIKSRIDFLIIKGTWTTNAASSSYSRLLDHFNDLSDRVVDFDNSLSEDERYGKSLRKQAFAVGHDPNAKVMLKKTIYKIDNEAVELLKDGIRLFAKTAEDIKNLINDYNSNEPKIVININKLKWDFPNEIPDELSQIYKKLYNFIILLKFYLKKPAK